VLGLEAERIAGAFLVSAEAMTKRLVRAKQKIRVAGLRFEEPEPSDLRERLHAVLEAIYAAYALADEGGLNEGEARDELAGEAIYLGRVVAELSQDPEALGLLSLLQFLEARRPAQGDPAGEFVPLLEQDPTLWDRARLEEAYALLGGAASHKVSGPFQLEAAIQAAHCHRARTGVVPWPEIYRLYAALVAQYPTVGSQVAFAVAAAQAEGPPHGFRILEQLATDRVKSYQPWWVASAHLHEMAGDPVQAARCLERAIGLTTKPRMQRFLKRKLHKLRGEPA
jgi:RNA polymerase sigma-70 factor (ECF subfamily)